MYVNPYEEQLVVYTGLQMKLDTQNLVNHVAIPM